MSKKLQNSISLSIFIILVLLTLPGLYLIAKQKSDNIISIIILILSQLFIVLSISKAIINTFISFIIEIFSNESNSLPCEIIYGNRKIQSLSKFYLILIIMSGYCLVCLFVPLPYMVIYSSMFIPVYQLSTNIVPNKILFANNECIIHNKINNTFYTVKSYSIEQCNCTLFLSDNSKYSVIIENANIENLIKKFELANITQKM